MAHSSTGEESQDYQVEIRILGKNQGQENSEPQTEKFGQMGSRIRGNWEHGKMG